MQSCFVLDRGKRPRDLIRNKFGEVATTESSIGGKLNLSSAADHVQANHIQSDIGWAEFSISFFIQNITAPATYGAFFNAEPSYLDLSLYRNASNTAYNYTFDGGDYSAFTGAPNLFDGEPHIVTFTLSVSANEQNLYVDGELGASSTDFLATPSFTSTGFHFGDDSTFNAGMLWEAFVMHDRPLTANEVKAWHADFYHFLKKRARYLVEAPVTAVDLVVADALHAHAVDNVTLQAGVDLVVADSLLGHAADNATLTQLHVLAIADALHGQTVDNVTLTQVHQLAVADALHAHAVDNVELSTAINLSIADALHAHTAENIDITQIATLAVADALHAHAADALALTQEHILIVSDTLHAHLVDGVGLQDTTVRAGHGGIFVIQAENRTLLVLPENRTLTVPAESRITKILD